MGKRKRSFQLKVKGKHICYLHTKKELENARKIVDQHVGENPDTDKTVIIKKLKEHNVIISSLYCKKCERSFDIPNAYSAHFPCKAQKQQKKIKSMVAP